MFSGTGRFRAPFAAEGPRLSGVGGAHPSFAPAGIGAAFDVPRLGEANGCCCTSARSITRRRCGSNGRRSAHHEGGYTPFASTSPTHCDAETRRRPSWSGPKTIRTIWRSRAASRTGSWSRTRSGIRGRRASGRPSGWSACRRRASATSAGRRTWRAGRSASRRGSPATPRDELRLARAAAAPATRSSPTTPTRSSPARCTAASPSPIRASTTSATSCCGARESPTLIEADDRAARTSAAS